MEAITHHGTLAGSYLALRRLIRCHPFNEGGVDLVPLKANAVVESPDSDKHSRDE